MSEGGHDRCLKVVDAEQLTAAEVAGELRKSQRTVLRLAETGRLAGRKTRNGWLFDPQTPIVEFQKGADEKRAA